VEQSAWIPQAAKIATIPATIEFAARFSIPNDRGSPENLW
jgi:hypothetical protein